MANQQGVDVGYFYNTESTGISSLLVTLTFTVEITAWKQWFCPIHLPPVS
jgi:hypothetical protein